MECDGSKTSANAIAGHGLDTLEEHRRSIAVARYKMIAPLQNMPNRTREDVRKRSQEVGVGSATLYRWLAKLEATGIVSSLAPGDRPRSSRLPGRQDQIVSETLEEFYQSQQKPSVQEVYREVWRRCLNEGIVPPCRNTVRRRLLQLDPKVVARKREGRAAARRFDLSEGRFPDGNFPLQTVQIDHTKLDVIVVTEDTREPISQRAWITLAIDVFSRMVTGYYVSLDPPGAFGTAMCIAHSILPKDDWLSQNKLEVEWPCYGLMDTIHVDNAMEFHGSALESACLEWGIDIVRRPIGTPHYGGHVERMLGTLARSMKKIRGATFSNPRERGTYNSSDKAVFTLAELEQWIAIQILEIYHRQVHAELKLPPLRRWEEGVYGTSDQPGTGLPPLVQDPAKLRLDFMPRITRTIQNYGVLIDGTHYWHPIFRRWALATNPGGHGRREFVFRRDPRNDAYIYFFDPALRQYIEIPRQNKDRPPMSIWERRALNKQLIREGRSHVDDGAIYRAFEKQRKLQEEAKERTRKRRAQIGKRTPTRTLGIEIERLNPILDEPIEGPIEPFPVIDL
jgi:putative transposase